MLLFVRVPPECSCMDSIVLHTVQLLQHCKTLQSLITMAHQQAEQNVSVTVYCIIQQ